MQYLQTQQIDKSPQALMKMIEPGLGEFNIKAHELGGKDCDTLYEYCKYTVKAELVLSWSLKTGDILVEFALPGWQPKNGTRTFSVYNSQYTADMCIRDSDYYQSSISVMQLKWDPVRGLTGSFHTVPKKK